MRKTDIKFKKKKLISVYFWSLCWMRCHGCIYLRTNTHTYIFVVWWHFFLMFFSLDSCKKQWGQVCGVSQRRNLLENRNFLETIDTLRKFRLSPVYAVFGHESPQGSIISTVCADGITESNISAPLGLYKTCVWSLSNFTHLPFELLQTKNSSTVFLPTFISPHAIQQLVSVLFLKERLVET